MIRVGLKRNFFYQDLTDRPVAPWFEFGRSPDGTLVDLADTEGDVFTNVPAAKAAEIVKLREKFLEDLVKILNQ